jgi:outer membrane protein assembly factor BamB
MKRFAKALAVLTIVGILTPVAQAEDAKTILDAAGVTGGLVVHLGCGDGKLTAGLRASDRYLVHGLDADAGNVAKARKHVRSLGIYGKVSIDQLDGAALPYADNLVNLLVTEDLGDVPMSEVMRVLAPGGVVTIKDGGSWKKTVKPRPADIDEWTHDLHDAGGNAVAADRVAGPPQHLQWTAGPLWARSHGYTPSVSAMVSAGGRVFWICDETLTGVDDTVPSTWFLVARDAFSGVLLWKRPVPDWGSKPLSGTSDTGAGVTTGRFTMPPNVGKRLVAVGDTVYVTLGATAPVTAIDAATGEVRRVYKDTAHADEILCDGGRLFLTINPPNDARPPVGDGRQSPVAPPGKHVCAVDAKTGRVLWKKGPFVGVRSGRGQDPFGRLELAAEGGKVFFLTTESIECLAAETGKTVWKLDRPALPDTAVRKLGFAGMYEYLLTVLVVHDGVVLLAQPEPNTRHTYHTMPGTLYAFDAADGRQLWKHGYGAWGHCTQPDVFVVGDVVWTHVNAETKFGVVWGSGAKAFDSSKVDYRIQSLELRTGKLRKELRTKDIFNVGHHHRCYRNRITERFLMASRRGVEFVDLESGQNTQNHWVRSGCLLGNLPCNGLVYVAPHPCGCYIEAKLTAFNALAAQSRAATRAPQPTPRLHRGPAYAPTIDNRKSTIGNSDWPTYRHDPRRTGATDSTVPAKLTVAWQSDVGTTPSAPVIADGKVLVADVDAHTVHALNADDGKGIWQYTAGARVHTPPTFHEGRAIFGSADGRVYSLRAADGALAWRFDAAPNRSLVCAFDQLESPWPVPGVLVQDDKCWFAAGRSSYLDGGIRVTALDPATGKVADEQTIYSPDPKTGRMAQEPSQKTVAGVLNDVPGSDGASVFIRQQIVSSPEARTGMHLFATGGFLDASWFNRTFWKAGRAQTSGVMVLGEDAAYGVELYHSRSRETVFKPGAKAYRLVCRPLSASVPRKPGKSDKSDKKKRKSPKDVSKWEQRVGIRITALVRAGDVLFVAGSPDVVDPADPHGAWEGRKGGVLAAFSTSDGKKLAEYKLPAPPVWDGLAAAGGRLYISLQNGKVLCFRGAD